MCWAYNVTGNKLDRSILCLTANVPVDKFRVLGWTLLVSQLADANTGDCRLWKQGYCFVKWGCLKKFPSQVFFSFIRPWIQFSDWNISRNAGASFRITYLLTPWCRVLLEKLTGLQLVKKFPAFHGTRRFITTLTSVRHLSLSWANPIQSTYPHPTSWRSILILSTHLRLGLPSGLLPSGFPTKTLYTPTLLTHTRHIPSPSNSSRFYHPHNIGWGVQII